MLDDHQLRSYSLAEIEKLLQRHGKNMKDNYPMMPRPDVSLIHHARNMLIYNELSYNRRELEIKHDRLMSTMTLEQRKVYNTIINRVNAKRPGIFFVYGYGGTVKTFIWKALSSALRSKGDIVLTIASSGIAALLIHEGEE